MNQQLLEIAITAVRTYAESHPRPPHVSQKQAAEMLGITAPTMRKLIAAGTIKLNKCGLIPIMDVDRVIAGRD
ncbi:MAG TPA: helix-turn-helix domain-containing protein [Rhodocyclaceae bacterium]|nr:helix-turn-helix domain-containing protein [Rhodocyclaceae bacterium]